MRERKISVQLNLILHYIIIVCMMIFISMSITVLVSPWFSALLFYIFNEDPEKHQILYIISFILPPVSIFLVMNFIYAKRIYNIFLFFFSWITRLTEGIYDKPDYSRKSHGIFFSVYRELYDRIVILTNGLKESEDRRRKFDEMQKDWTIGVTHDLKTPLSYIRGYSEMLKENKYSWSKEETEKFITIIYDKALHMQELIDDLNNALKLKQGEVYINAEENDYVLLLESMIRYASQQPNKENTQISLITTHQKIISNFDETLLKRAILNLVMNAVLHNPDGTVINILLQKLTIEGHISIEIKDNGKGLTQDEVENLFERYYRGSSTDYTEGTGLGMSIAKQLILAHKGQIEISSAESKGTTILIKIPYKD